LALLVKTYAKINLFLNVVSQRPDGYHNIETVLQAIDLFDQLQFSLSDALQIQSNFDIALKDNLVYKAAAALQLATGVTFGACIKLEKNIPLAAGLGGGSSDAAATLLCLNKLWETNLSLEELKKIGSPLGADIAFFLGKQPTALAKGIGDELFSLSQNVDFWLIVAKPDFGVSAREAYDLYDKNPNKDGLVDNFTKSLAGSSVSKIASGLYNALEKPVMEAYPKIKKLKELFIKAGAIGAQMSGSGSAVFAITQNNVDAQRIADEALKKGYQAFVLRPSNYTVKICQT